MNNPNPVTEKINNIVNTNINNMKQIIQNNNYLVNMMVILFIVFLIIMLIFYIKNEISKKENNCSNINSQYSDGK